jgi:hypothetical protein
MAVLRLTCCQLPGSPSSRVHFSVFSDFALGNCPIKPTAAAQLHAAVDRLIDVRFRLHNGLKSDIAPCPKSAMKRRRGPELRGTPIDAAK